MPVKATIKSGYRQTDIGAIPEQWEVKAIDEIAKVKGGKRLPLGKGLIGKPTLHPYIRVTDMKLGGVVLDDIKYVPEDVFPVIKNYRIFAADIFISVAGTLGIVGRIPPELDGANLTENADKITDISCDRDFLLYNLMSERIQGIIESEKTVGAQPKLALTRIGKFKIGLPPTTAEQSTIATVLSDTDELIDSLDKLINKKRDLKQAAMQQLLTGRNRLPGFADKWEETTLGEIGECVIGLTYKPGNVVEHGLLVLRSSNVYNGHLAFEDNVYVNVAVREKLVTRKGDILICVRNGSRALIGKCAMIDDRGAGQTFGAFMSVYRTKYSQFIFHVLQSHDIQQQIRENIGATINQITNKDMKAFRLRLPPEPEQHAIATVLSDMDTEIMALEHKREKCVALKQGMMQELLTGKTRLI